MVKLFGTTLRETLDTFAGAHLGRAPETERQAGDRMRALMRIIVSLCLIGVAVYCIKLGQDNKTIGASLLSAVAGYWLK